MKKEKSKFIMFIFVFFAFLLNINDVSAADTCSCYYHSRGTTADNGDQYNTYYLAQIDFNKSEYENANPYYSPTIAFFGEKGFNTVTGQDGAIEDKTSEVSWLGVAFSKDNSDLYNTVSAVFDNCSVESCGNIRTQRYIGPVQYQDTGGLKFYSFNNSKNLLYEANPMTLGAVTVSFQSVSKEEFEQLKVSDNVGESSEDLGLSGYAGIVNWGNLISGTGYYSINDVGKACNSVAPIAEYLSQLLWIICVASIIILVIMTAINFVQAIVGSEEDKLLKAFKNLKTRIIVLILLLLLPTIVSFVIGIYNDNADGVVKIGSDNEPYCAVFDENTSNSDS